MIDQTDVELFKKAQQGCRESLGVLYLRHYDYLRRYVYKYHYFEPDDLDDILHNVFLGIMKSTGTNYEPTVNNLTRWLLVVTKNAAKAKYKRSQYRYPKNTLKRIHGTIIGEDDVEYDVADLYLEDPSKGQDEIFFHKNRLRKTFKNFNKLPDKFRRPLQLHIFEGLTYKEIADQEGITIDMVKVRIYRARKHLKEML